MASAASVMEPREATSVEDRENGETSGRPDGTGRTPVDQADSVGGRDEEHLASSRAASLLEEAHGQLASLDWALLMLIPAAELQAVDRTLSLDPGGCERGTGSGTEQES